MELNRNTLNTLPYPGGPHGPHPGGPHGPHGPHPGGPHGPHGPHPGGPHGPRTWIKEAIKYTDADQKTIVKKLS